MSVLSESPEDLEKTGLARIVSGGKQYSIVGEVGEGKKKELVLDALKEIYKERGEEIHHDELLDYTNDKYEGKYCFGRSMFHSSLTWLEDDGKVESVSKRDGPGLKTFYRPKE